MAHEVEIAHKDGRRYGVTVTDFHAIYEEQGFKIERNADQTPYVAPKPRVAESSEKPARADAKDAG